MDRKQSTTVGRRDTAPPVSRNSMQGEAVRSHDPSHVSKTAPVDPRLAALKISPDNGLIEFVRRADGKVIKEVDTDPNSLGFQKPLREYTYAGDTVLP
jgi:hypothetical protein